MNVEASCQIGVKGTVVQRLLAGAIGGLAGGVVFGMMMWKMGMLTMIGSMMGVESALVGFGIHMMISVIFGLLAGILLKFMPSCPGQGMLFAVVFGVALWVMGPLVAMPLMMGGAVFQITQASMMSLMGHVIYALVTLFVAKALLPRFAGKRA